MKQYTITARMRKDTCGTPIISGEYKEETIEALNQFPVLVEAQNKDDAKRWVKPLSGTVD